MRYFIPIEFREIAIPSESFTIPKEESILLMGAAAKRIKHILTLENIVIDSDTVLLKLVQKYFPDMRRLVNEIQYKTGAGSLESSALTGVVNTELKAIVSLLAKRDAKGAREWVATQPYLSLEDIVRDLYDNMNAICSKNTMAQFISIIADWSYKSRTMPDQEIAVIALLVDLMVNTELSELKD